MARICPNCGTETYRSIGGRKICPKCGMKIGLFGKVGRVPETITSGNRKVLLRIVYGILSTLAVSYIALMLWGELSEKTENNRRRQICNQVWPLLSKCREEGETPVVLRGKCIVWDLERNTSFFSMLPFPQVGLDREFEATSSDTAITLFLVASSRKNPVGGHVDAPYGGRYAWYLQFADVYIVYWPERQAVGVHTIRSDWPEMKTRILVNGTRIPIEAYGDLERPMAEWIKSLPRAR